MAVDPNPGHYREQQPRTLWSNARSFEWALTCMLFCLGLLHPESIQAWYTSFFVMWAFLLVFILGGCAVVHVTAGKFGKRIQGDRKKPAPIVNEAFETARAMFVGATFGAWPLSQALLGHPTSLTWDLSKCTGEPGVFGSLCQGILAIFILDFYLYWKHRLLHSRHLFIFHKHHHSFHDPTPFAGFSVGPVESVLTFSPSLTICLSGFQTWAPIYVFVTFWFILLNFYLHCGIDIELFERYVPKILMMNTSAHHNIHHSHTIANFGEALTVWDWLCGTRLEDFRARAAKAAPPTSGSLASSSKLGPTAGTKKYDDDSMGFEVAQTCLASSSGLVGSARIRATSPRPCGKKEVECQ